MNNGSNSDPDKTRAMDPNATRILTPPPSQKPTVILPAAGNSATTRLMTAAPPSGGAGAVPVASGTHILPRTPTGVETPAAFDPVVGWLVVIGGPGVGNSLIVRYGQNSIGRGENQRIVLDFGDQRISRETHAIIVYEDRSRRFFLRDTGQTNLVYHGDNVVLQPVELKDRDIITLGDTTLMFIAMCNENFDWLAGLAAHAAPGA